LNLIADFADDLDGGVASGGDPVSHTGDIGAPDGLEFKIQIGNRLGVKILRFADQRPIRPLDDLARHHGHCGAPHRVGQFPPADFRAGVEARYAEIFFRPAGNKSRLG
jgi:hypothetical protein